MNLRTRLALLLALLAGSTAAAVGFAGHRVAERQFTGEIRTSLDTYATALAAPDGFVATRACAGGEPRQPTEPERRAAGRRGGERGAEPPGLIIQCLDETGAIFRVSAPVALPVDGGDIALATDVDGRRARSVELDDRSYRMLTVALPGGGAAQIARETTETDRVLTSLASRYTILVVVASGLAAIAGWFVARAVTKPISALTATAERITADGLLDVELPQSRGEDETGRLVRSFSTMVDALRTSKAQQTALVHDAGHELRTPLTALRTNIGVLHRHPELAADQRRAIVDDLHLELAELSSLVDELVTLGADHALDDPVEHADLAALLRPVCERWGRRSGRDVTLSCPPGIVVSMRPRLIARAVGNLVSNAAKFSVSGPIEVSAAISPKDRSRAEVSVRDHGPGFVESDLTHVFDRFFRSTVHRGGPGSGLGLAMVAQIATDHGGRADAANDPRGGAVVTFTLPVAE